MNNLSDDEKPAILEYLARRVSQIDRPLDSVTKTELLGQSHGRAAHRNNSARAPDLVNDIAAVVSLHLLLDRRHHVGRTQVYLLSRRRAAGYKICAHK